MLKQLARCEPFLSMFYFISSSIYITSNWKSFSGRIALSTIPASAPAAIPESLIVISPSWKMIALAVVHTNRQNQDQCRDNDISGFCKVYLVFYHISQTNRRNHTLKNQRYSANGCLRHYLNHRSNLRTERKCDRKKCSQTYHRRIEYFG